MPPPQPVEIIFPMNNDFRGQPWTASSPPPDLHALLARMQRPNHLTDKFVEALNIRIRPVSSLCSVVPLQPDGTPYMPSIETTSPTSKSTYADVVKPDAGIGQKLEDRLKELKLDNCLAFRAINRKFTQGVNLPKIALMRKFWEGLEIMSSYWDSSQDHYYEVEESEVSKRRRARLKRRKLARAASSHDHANCILRMAAVPLQSTEHDRDGNTDFPDLGNDTAASEEQHSDREDQFQGDLVEKLKDSEDDGWDTSDITPEPDIIRYKGRRTSSGTMMPGAFRVETVKAFIEGVVWSFGSQYSTPRNAPFLQVKSILVPIRKTAAVYRTPKERTSARQGWLEGPLLGVLVRHELEFTDFRGNRVQSIARMDMLREIGALLQIAQERRREGKTEVRPGEGKWWTTRPRWGGGTGSNAANELGNSGVVAVDAGLSTATQPPIVQSKADCSQRRKRRGPGDLWKDVSGGRGLWDAKTKYLAIGKDQDSDYDEVSPNWTM